MNKKVVYTSIVGGFDSLIQPTVIDDSFDYICFVEKGKKDQDNIGAWRIEEIPYENKDNRKLSRYPKLLPHKVLSGYDYSLWIDGNVSIRDRRLYDVINDKIEKGIIYSGVNHWGRDCAYEEAVGCVNSGKEPLSTLLKTVTFLKKHGFPRHFGLYENNVILRCHKNSTIVKFDEMWWDLYLRYANRDQLCHPYCYKKCGLDFDYLLPKDYCARNHEFFLYVKHLQRPEKTKGIRKMYKNLLRKVKVMILKSYITLP